MKDYVFQLKNEFYLIPADKMPEYPANPKESELATYTAKVDEQKARALKVHNGEFLREALEKAQANKLPLKKHGIYELPRNYKYKHQTIGSNIIIEEDKEAMLWDEVYRLIILRTPWTTIQQKFTIKRKVEVRKISDLERSKGRSEGYWQMSADQQWAEDKRLGILDWDGK